MTVKKGGLGRGLDSLFETESEKGVTEIMLSEIEPNRDQPRKTFDEKRNQNRFKWVSQVWHARQACLCCRRSRM